MNIDEPCSGATSWQSRGQCHLVTSKSNESVKRREGKESDTPLRKRISTDSNNVPVLPVTKHNLSSSWRSMLSARRCHSSALLFLSILANLCFVCRCVCSIQGTSGSLGATSCPLVRRRRGAPPRLPLRYARSHPPLRLRLAIQTRHASKSSNKSSNKNGFQLGLISLNEAAACVGPLTPMRKRGRGGHKKSLN